jgi:A/G-specific adenine glycosylase
MLNAVAKALLGWYADHARRLPWRGTSDPYAIWVSEIMLQQTQVETVIPYYRRWMRALPTMVSLAEASNDEVLKLWEGLGYYRRALLMRQAAQQLVGAGQDRLPKSIDELRALPGIGPYTSHAIAAFAFGVDALALDGNLKRVLARVFNIDADIRSPEGESRLRQAGEGLLPQGQASAFNQALMDLGAEVCVPARPRCPQCPIQIHCAAFQAGVQEARPVKHVRAPRPHQVRFSAVVKRRGRVLVRRRPEGELLGGMWEFPGVETERAALSDEQLASTLARAVGMRVRVARRLGEFQHAYTHFTVRVEAFLCAPEQAGSRSGPDSRWVAISELGELPMGKIDRDIALTLAEELK